MEYPLTRLRRNRKASWSRSLIAENHVSPSDLIWPLFIQEGSNLSTPIETMPGVYRLSIDLAVQRIKEAYNLGIPAVALFPYIDINLRSTDGRESYNPDNLICRAIKTIKHHVPEIGIITDIALDPYTSHGQDGVINDQGYVLNDETIEILCQQALVTAQAGCDVVAPSDMMDGRVLKIREHLESAQLHNTQIMAYSAKYASNFYGPFRDAVGSKSILGKADKKNYQMDPANSKEAILEVEMDIAEGADMVIIKPGMPYLDIIKNISDTFAIPVIAYQVSGEYAMIKIAAQNNIFDEQKVFLESMLSFKRAGASAILTYAALDIAKFLQG